MLLLVCIMIHSLLVHLFCFETVNCLVEHLSVAEDTVGSPLEIDSLSHEAILIETFMSAPRRREVLQFVDAMTKSMLFMS